MEWCCCVSINDYIYKATYLSLNKDKIYDMSQNILNNIANSSIVKTNRVSQSMCLEIEKIVKNY